MTEIPNVTLDSREDTILASPDRMVKARDLFGLDIDMEVPAFSEADERVPDLDPAYVFDPDTTLAILAAHVKEIDRAVLAGSDADMAAEPPRERLFDVLMRRIEVLAPHKAAMRTLFRSAVRNPGLAVTLNGLAVRSQQWMLTAADISASGPRGMVRAQGLALLFASVLRTWLDDDDPGLARTMAALDRALAQGQHWSGCLDDLLRIPARVCGRRPRRRADEAGDETIAV